jgi:hypothetical protein
MRWSAGQAHAWIIKQKPLVLREWTADMGPKIGEAQTKLADLISGGKVKAWGRKEPHGPLEQIPNDLFRISDVPVVVGVHGDITTPTPHKKHVGQKVWHSHKPYVGPRWHSIEFDADEIKRECPKPPPPSTNDWMLTEAQRLNGKGKRDVMVQDCMQATNCTRREALTAYAALPSGLRRARGKPPKNFG